LNEIQVLLVLARHNLFIVILIAVFRVLKWLPRWIAAMRAAALNDDGKADRARKAVEVIKPSRRRIGPRT
jgi:hypothetical protein